MNIERKVAQILVFGREKWMAQIKSHEECCIWMPYTCHLIYIGERLFATETDGSDGSASDGDGMLLISTSHPARMGREERLNRNHRNVFYWLGLAANR